MQKKAFTAAEITSLFMTQAGADTELDLGGGLRAVRMATKDRPVFSIERDGKQLYHLDEANAGELVEISAVLWEKYAPFVSTAGDLEERLTPDALKDRPERTDLEPDPLGLTPDHLREIIKDPALARRLATGTATRDDILTPENLKDKPEGDPLAYPGDASI